jgi:hypothetical protein
MATNTIFYEEINTLVEQVFEDVWVPEEDPQSFQDLYEAGTPEDVLSRMWQRGTAEGQIKDERQRQILEQTGRWLLTLRRSAEVKLDEVDALYDRWAKSSALQEVGLIEQPREIILEQLGRTIAGLAHTIQNERPLTATPARFRINWKDGDGEGNWEGSSHLEPFSLRQAAEDSAELMGNFASPIWEAVAKQLVTDLRRGELTLPRLPRSSASTNSTTWLEYVPPRLEIVPGKDALHVPELPPPPPVDPTIDVEAVIWSTAPMLAQYYDRALAIATRRADSQAEFADVLAQARAEQPEWFAVFSEIPSDEGTPGPVLDLIGKLAKATDLPASSFLKFLVVPLKVMCLIHHEEAQSEELAEQKASSNLQALRSLFK